MTYQEIFRAKKWNISLIEKNDVPVDTGIYCYLDNSATSIQYVGSAVGKKGLRGRICAQHLNSNYLENRKEKFSKKDTGQIDKGVKKNGKIVIEKSAFRKNLARTHDLTPGDQCLNFLKENFLLVFLSFEELTKQEIHEIETNIIREFTPKYNIRIF